MAFSKRWKEFRQSRKKYVVTFVLAAIALLLAGYSYWRDSDRTKLVYKDSLEREVATVNGEQLTLADMAFYVAYEENQVEQHALAYNTDDTEKYWNLHVDGVYVRIAARNATIQMLVHDELFYQMAIAEGIELSDEEEEALLLSVQDFWYDLESEGKEKKLGIDKENIENAIRKMMYAQKMQLIYSELQGASYEDYEFHTDTYEAFEKTQDVKINKNVLKRIRFGDVTLEHGKKEE